MVISKDIFRVTPLRALITLLITYLPSPLPLQVHPKALGLRPKSWEALRAFNALGVGGCFVELIFSLRSVGLPLLDLFISSSFIAGASIAIVVTSHIFACVW